MTFRKGQVTVLVLLLALMGVTVGLSQVSRSLSDFKQVSYVDSGVKAYSAAEVGLQYGFSQLPATAVALIPTCGTATVPTNLSTAGVTLAKIELMMNNLVLRRK